jgi:serpin B
MSKDQMFDAIAHIDENLVDECLNGKIKDVRREATAEKKVPIWRKIVFACAVPVAALLIIFVLLPAINSKQTKLSLLNKLISETTVYAGESKEEALKQAGIFGAKLLCACMTENENALVSPLSIITALGMTANGAEGQTLAEMEQVLGLSRENMNRLLGLFIEGLEKDENSCLRIANSIWIKDSPDFVVKDAFLQTNTGKYNASVFKAPFDGRTLSDINSWVDEKTYGMIKNIINDIPPEAMMYLINALAFDAEWARIYKVENITTGEFKNADGTTKTVDFMHSYESNYLKTASATGFVKDYKGLRYSFIALLPNKNKTVVDVVAELPDFLANFDRYGEYSGVQVSLPKFSAEYSVELSEQLKILGMKQAFAGEADFSSMSNMPLFISRVIHKTFIEVNERGTRAGAATGVEATNAGVLNDIKKVILDRPFVYMLYDNETKMPFFIGVENNI